MQVEANLGRVTYFHEHLDPELAIGYRACLLAQRELMLEEMWHSQVDVIVENTTLSPDAVQVLIECTFKKGGLKTCNNGGHCYKFILKKEYTLEVKLKKDALPLLDDFKLLEQKVNTGDATPWENDLYWAIIDRQVNRLLQLPDEVLFDIQRLPIKET